MKKSLGLVLVFVFLMTACGTKTASSTEANKSTAVSSESTFDASASSVITDEKSEFFQLVENNGKQEYVDTEKSPFEDCGIHTVVDKSAQTITFFKTDKEGVDTVEYILFSPEKNEVEKYYYVSMMGTGFYYYLDLEAGELVRIEDKDHQDTTESAKENGRFDGAAEDMKAEVEALEKYFFEYFGLTIAEAVAAH